MSTRRRTVLAHSIPALREGSMSTMRRLTAAACGCVSIVLAGTGVHAVSAQAEEVCLAKDSSSSGDMFGCQPLSNNESSVAWLRGVGRNLEVEALPHHARGYVCYNGRLSALSSEPAHADTAVVVVERFLSKPEIDHMTSVVERFVPSEPGYRFKTIASKHYPQLPESWGIPRLSDDHVLQAIEERIANFTGVPLNAMEMPLQIARTTPASEQQNSLFHHDKNKAPARHVTAIIYLTDVEDGGETLFPALPAPVFEGCRSRVQGDALLRQMAKYGRKLIEGQRRDDGSLPANPALAVNMKMHNKMHAMCPLPQTNGAGRSGPRPLAVKPKPGRAVFLWHETVDGHGLLADIIHGGCAVRQGRKLALQKFKQYARGTDGCLRSRFCAA